MSHVRRKPPQEPGRLVRKKYKFKLSKLARNALTIIIILIFVLSGMGVAALMGAFS
ncbi:MAG: hypothetical protein JW891_17000 [Candidatus Lokiarchaeota archaeon]|nr:hypothetical protein [Candidatus Lokiarchaeota archaeon]